MVLEDLRQDVVGALRKRVRLPPEPDPADEEDSDREAEGDHIPRPPPARPPGRPSGAQHAQPVETGTKLPVRFLGSTVANFAGTALWPTCARRAEYWKQAIARLWQVVPQASAADVLLLGVLDQAEVAPLERARLRELLDHVREVEWEKAFGRYRKEAPQREAIEAPYSRHLLVNAGPGAGKTAVLLMRAAHMIRRQGLRPEQILVLAFNRAVVQEIRERLRELLASWATVRTPGDYGRRRSTLSH